MSLLLGNISLDCCYQHNQHQPVQYAHQSRMHESCELMANMRTAYTASIICLKPQCAYVKLTVPTNMKTALQKPQVSNVNIVIKVVYRLLIVISHHTISRCKWTAVCHISSAFPSIIQRLVDILVVDYIVHQANHTQYFGNTSCRVMYRARTCKIRNSTHHIRIYILPYLIKSDGNPV